MPNITVPAAATGLPNPRRTFLRQLAVLPLIGGSVALIGQPEAVAEPITATLLQEYSDWLGWERHRICAEMYGERRGRDYERIFSHVTHAYDWHRGARGDQLFDSPSASSRAALVLSAVGCDWREPQR